jgi:O-antigen/teichoic acid export membrane protein
MNTLISWLSKVFRTDVRYIVKGGFWLTCAKILSAVASLISSVAFANLLPEETYGTFQYVLSIMGLLTIPTLFGIEAALTRSVARGHYADFDLALRTRLTWGLLGGMASLAVAGYYYLAGNSMLSLLFVLVAIFVPLMDPFHTYISILGGKKKFDILARDEVVTRMSVALLLALLVFFTDNIFYVLFTFLFSTTVLRYSFLQHVYRTEPRNDKSDPTMLDLGKHLTAIGIFGRVATQVDKILVFHFAGGATLAAFFLSFMPMKLTQNLLGGLTTLAMPKFSANSIEIIRKTLPAKLLKLYALIIPAVILYELTAHLFFDLLFPRYPESVFFSQLLFLQLLFFPLSLLSTAITAQNEKTKLYIHSSAYAVIRIILLLLLVPTFGVIGAISSILITSLLSNTFLVYLFFKK